MKNPKDKEGIGSGTDRDRRLAEALRANLRRRKAQERDRAGKPVAAEGGALPEAVPGAGSSGRDPAGT